MPGRPHRHGDRLTADADLERLLDSDHIVGHTVGDTDDLDARRRIRGRLHQRSIGEPGVSPQAAARDPYPRKPEE
jgi:hypothetical protein